jgi:hypothetical protein
MRKSDQVKLGDIYGAMLRNVVVVKESKVKSGGNDLSDNNASPLIDGGPQEKGGFHKSLEDTYKGMCDNDEDEEQEQECDCEGECECHKKDSEEDNEELDKKSNESFVNQKTKKLEIAMAKPGISEKAKEDLQKQINALIATEDEENITESKKIAKQTLNRIMAKKKSTFDKLYESVIKENFGFEEQNEDLEGLNLDDAASDEELGDDMDFGGDDEGDGDQITVTLDREVARQLCDMLQAAMGDDMDMGDEGDDIDFGDEGDDMDMGDEGDDMDFDEDEETETVGSKAVGSQHKLQNRNNKVSGRPQPKGGSAQHSVTDKVGNDGDYGHALHGAKKYNDGRSNKVSNLKQGADLF